MWEIYAYQNAPSLLGIFNAAAAIHASGDYLAALAMVTFCGFIAALVAYAVAPEKLQGWRWLATVTLVFSTLILPKATVGIVDRTGTEGMQVVDNVPLGVAALGSITSSIGHAMTSLFETAFQALPGRGTLPGELSYQRNGLVFGSRLIRETSAMNFQDPSLRSDLASFITNCTMFDLMDGTISHSAFSQSTDVWPLMAKPNPARFTTITMGGARVEVTPCPIAYVGFVERMGGHLVLMERMLGIKMNPTLGPEAASSVIAAQVEQAYIKNGIADAAVSGASIIRQHAMLNVIADAGKLAGQRSNDPAAMLLAMGRAQATAQQNASWLNHAKIAEQALPVFRNVVEALAYALFPIVVLLLLVTSGRESVLALKGYALLLVWIQLWPPLFAILNYMATIYGSYDLAAAATQGTGVNGLSLQTASTIYTRAISGEAVVGYLSMGVPAIAWAATRRLEGIGSTLLGGVTSLQASTSNATSAAAAGNVSLGNLAMDQVQLSPTRTSAFMSSAQHDITGDTVSSNVLSGRSAVSLLRNQGFASRVVSARVSEQDAQEAARQTDAARSEAVAANLERASVTSEAYSRGIAKLTSSRSSTSTSSSSFEQFGETLNRLDQISRSVAETTGLTRSQVARVALGLNGRLGLNNSNEERSLSGGLNVQAGLDKSYTSGLSAAEQKVLTSMSSDQLAEFKQFGDRIARDRTYIDAVSSDSKEGSELASRLSRSTTRSERAEATLSERVSHSDRVSSAYERGESISVDIAADPHNQQMFLRYAQQYGGNSTSARVMLDAEIARQSLRPSTIAHAPLEHIDPVAWHREQLASRRLAPDIDGPQRRSHAGRRFSEPAPEEDRSQGLRHTIVEEAARLRTTTATANEGFDSRNEIKRGSDGSVGTRRSLLRDTAGQAARDGANILDEARKAISEVVRSR